MREHGQSYVAARNYAYRAVTGLTFSEVMARRTGPYDPRHGLGYLPQSWEQRVDAQRAEAASRVATWARARAWAQRLKQKRS